MYVVNKPFWYIQTQKYFSSLCKKINIIISLNNSLLFNSHQTYNYFEIPIYLMEKIEILFLHKQGKTTYMSKSMTNKRKERETDN